MFERFAKDRLFKAINRGQDTRAMRIVKKHGKLVHSRDSYSLTPLHMAASSGNVILAEYFLNQGADVNASSAGNTPLHSAAYEGHAAVTKLLLEHGASVNATNHVGATPLDKTVLARNDSPKSRPHMDQTIALLIAAGGHYALADQGQAFTATSTELLLQHYSPKPAVENTNTGVCDICSKRLSQGEGYLLTTSEVVTSVEYWKRTLQMNPIFPRLKFEKEKFLEVTQSASSTCASDTPWMVCETCISCFDVNRVKVQEAARSWRRTGKPSSGMKLCTVENNGLHQIVNIIDDVGYRNALNAAVQAYQEISWKLK